ncbi:hypothetical protein [Streptomyces hainanensis]|uniref:Uncharacterized protein n=1 Tax=Streptomyces hainanensis TaxID=402648 RepID=A0A4R4TPU4_9ACTN|nr:hypothetical protein [Streptomyces hainanensis]TDC80111.1 hypothetical protein E1283_01185 [Streptomyces hainanensis]
MDGTVESLLVTGIAVLGTLISAVLTQRQANRSLTQELDRLDQWRTADRAEQTRHDTALVHRVVYTALNTAARRYLAALTDQLHALGLGTGVEATTTELHEARAAHADSYAELQLVAPEAVLAAARTVNHRLNHTYGILMRLTNGTERPNDSPDVAQAAITDLWSAGLPELRESMRLDLDLPDTRRLRGR